MRVDLKNARAFLIAAGLVGLGLIGLSITWTVAARQARTPTEPSSSSRPPFGLPVEMRVPVAPVPLPAAGATHLVYELHVTNFTTGTLSIRRLEVMDGNRVMASFEDQTLAGLLVQPGTRDVSDSRDLGPGLRAIAFLWITLSADDPLPRTLQHRLTTGAETLSDVPIAVANAPVPVLGAPLAGEDWVAINGPSNTSNHRRAAALVNGSFRLAQRFAIDFARVGENGRTFTGDRSRNANFHAYGAELLAVGDGRVAGVRDGIPENVPGITSRAVPITPDTIAGNYVRLELGDGVFALYGHLQPGSLRVTVGDRVTRGQTLGLVGNSGNSTEPHLHFHVEGSGSSMLGAEGLPYVLDVFDVAPSRGAWSERRHELPLQNAIVRFR
jgi:hypothetical protein